jgi:hypothetical protein
MPGSGSSVHARTSNISDRSEPPVISITGVDSRDVPPEMCPMTTSPPSAFR